MPVHQLANLWKRSMPAREPGDALSPRSDPLDAVLRWIPGFGGYLRSEDRRWADKRQREWLAERLERGKQGLERYARALADAGQLDAILPVDRVRSQTDQLCHRLRGAMQGGVFFETDALDATRLDRIYEHDLALIETVAATADQMEALGDQPAQASAKLSDIAERLVQLGDALDAREDLLRE